jgi:hypothetical protein
LAGIITGYPSERSGNEIVGVALFPHVQLYQVGVVARDFPDFLVEACTV